MTLSLKFMRNYTDDQGTFRLVFAFYFTSCATIRECVTKIWSVVIKQFERSIVTKISE